MDKSVAEVVTKVDGEIVDNDADFESRYIIPLKNPITFERKTYDKIDLSGLENIKAADMIAVNRILTRDGNIDVNQELSLEYALNLAARATSMPIEFYETLPPRVAMKVKRHVTSFLYSQE